MPSDTPTREELEEHRRYCDVLFRFRDGWPSAEQDLPGVKSWDAFLAFRKAGGTARDYLRMLSDLRELRDLHYGWRAEEWLHSDEVPPRPRVSEPSVPEPEPATPSCRRWVVRPAQHGPFVPYPVRLARGDFDGVWGRSCCSWTDEQGCWRYPSPRCSLRTREVVKPGCWVRGLAWEPDRMRQLIEEPYTELSYCVDREGFLRTGRQCGACPDRQQVLFPEVD